MSELNLNQPIDSASKQEADNLFGSDNGEQINKGGQQENVEPKEPISLKQQEASDSANKKNQDAKKTPEEVIRSLQSKYDKTSSELEKEKGQREAYEEYKSFVDQFDSDETFRKAVVAQYYPDAFKPANPIELVKTKLTEEFGKDFDPEEAGSIEKNLYNQRAQSLYQEMSSQKANIPNLEALRKEKEDKRKANEMLYKEQKQKIIDETKWNNEQFNQFIEYASKLNLTDLVPSYVNAQSKVQTNIPGKSIGFVPGKERSQDGIKNEVDELFGTTPSGWGINK